MKNYQKTHVEKEARVELHDLIGLTGAEISINNLPAGVGVEFVHSHKQNEEIYAVLHGKGKAIIDGESVELIAGDWIRIAPSAERQLFASDDMPFSYACIQVKEHSLEGYTMDDAIIKG